MINVNKKITKYVNESSEGMAPLLSYIVKYEKYNRPWKQ